MRAPVFVSCSDREVMAFESARQAAQFMESVDVENGEYTAAYDADGRRLRVKVSSPTKRSRLFWFEATVLSKVTVEPAEEHPSGGEELKATLVRVLPGASADEPLSALVARASRELMYK